MTSHDLFGMPRHHPPTPSAGARLHPRQLAPAVVWRWIVSKATIILTSEIAEVNTPPKIFLAREADTYMKSDCLSSLLVSHE